MTLAYGLFSGGLDSLLAARLLMEQGIQPTLITFTSPFFTPENALASARQLGIEPVLADVTDDLVKLVKNPVHMKGRNLNPCIDCHALMFRKAAAMLAEAGGESGQPGFLFSGEVLGQRPLSQTRGSLNVVAKSSGARELILRPLSAKLLPPTPAEENGLVDRERLLGLSGRGRSAQLELAAKYDLKDFPAPAGGCLLTDPAFAARLKWLLAQPQAEAEGWPTRRLLEIYKHGRLFSAEPGLWAAVGRRQADNLALAGLAAPGDLIFHLEGRPGPTVLLPEQGREPGSASLALARELAAAYGDHGEAARVPVRRESPGLEPVFEDAEVRPTAAFADFMIPKKQEAAVQ